MIDPSDHLHCPLLPWRSLPKGPWSSAPKASILEVSFQSFEGSEGDNHDYQEGTPFG